MLKINNIAPQDYRNAMARFAGAVHVVTTDGQAGRRGGKKLLDARVHYTVLKQQPSEQTHPQRVPSQPNSEFAG